MHYTDRYRIINEIVDRTVKGQNTDPESKAANYIVTNATGFALASVGPSVPGPFRTYTRGKFRVGPAFSKVVFLIS